MPNDGVGVERSAFAERGTALAASSTYPMNDHAAVLPPLDGRIAPMSLTHGAGVSQ